MEIKCLRILGLMCLLCAFSRCQEVDVISSVVSEQSNTIDQPTSGQLKYNQNQKPLFKRCAQYNPVVKEEQDRDTFVIRVEAMDPDPPGTDAATLTYNIDTPPEKPTYFVINNKTGDIYTFRPIDRDNPDNPKEMYLTVRAVDNGWPTLADICTFKVTIEDINDNSPIFDQQEYVTQITEDFPINQEVLRVVAYDIDSGENARLSFNFTVSYGSATSDSLENYFRIDPDTGVVYLSKSLAGKSGAIFTSSLSAQDHGTPSRTTTINISFNVVNSGKSPPQIHVEELRSLEVPENFFDFQSPLIKITAESNSIGGVLFDLIKGKTVETNGGKSPPFILSPEGETSAFIKLARPLDYEQVTKYTLTITARNKDQLQSSISVKINVTDVNDEIPSFIEALKGSIVENNEYGAQALNVKALDNDGTSPNNLVRYKLLSHQEYFEIDEIMGTIIAKVKFDREETKVYHINVQAYDGAPSALSPELQFNSANKTFQITIEDQNDNSPKFTQTLYNVYNISENWPQGKSIIEVKAVDEDTASRINYTIIGGNVDDAFEIEVSTGRIKVKNKLDYEKQKAYNLTVRAFDGIYGDEANVIIDIFNENDEAPVFITTDGNITIQEEELRPDCLITVKAYDPDTSPDRPEKIEYFVRESFLSVGAQDGCVRLTKARNRDPPDGVEKEQAFVYAYDKNPGENTQTFLELTIHITDINDNAPFLKQTEVVWYENEPPGSILMLEAEDYDGPTNRGPFTYEIPPGPLDDSFYISNYTLYAKRTFDREEQKYYNVLINVTDSGTPQQSAISVLKVIIGDKNDNKAENGTSEIFVYKYEGFKTDIQIGRVYVNDLDDWDLPDKEFEHDGMPDPSFELSTTDKGMIVMRRSALNDTYMLHFKVTERFNGIQNIVYADVKVTVKGIPEEAVRKSGSIRLKGNSEDFVTKDLATGLSKKDRLQMYMSKILNASVENVDVFTVMPSPYNSSFFDVRFSAHGSPYYAPERLNKKSASEQDQLERELGVTVIMIDINECLNSSHCTNRSCANTMSIKDEAAVVFTNKTSFVGVKAIMEPICECKATVVTTCFNGGTPIEDGRCSCPEGFEGPNCEATGISFSGNGWALYPTFDSCNATTITVNVLTQTDNGLIFYAGPMTLRQWQNSDSFISLEVQNGYIVLKINVGAGIDEIVQDYKKINDGATHLVTIKYTLTDVQVEIDICSSECLKWKSLTKPGLLRVNGPLQVGGRVEQFSLGADSPTNRAFTGCISNLTYNGYLYNLGAPSDKENAREGACNFGTFQAATFGIDSNFLVAILVCIAILLCLLLAVVVHKRKQHNLNEKEMDDTRENIINYEDEGGGECDTNFDLSVLRNNYGDEKVSRDNLYKQAPDVPADIGTFLDDKKRACDKDALPYDDVRHYAYEGDGNSTGSLSSLASCTDDGDLKFNYLSSFGPRFRKLADMYGDDGSDI